MISAGARMRIPMRIRTGVPDLKVLERGVAGVLDVMTESSWDVADTAGFVVEGDSIA